MFPLDLLCFSFLPLILQCGAAQPVGLPLTLPTPDSCQPPLAVASSPGGLPVVALRLGWLRVPEPHSLCLCPVGKTALLKGGHKLISHKHSPGKITPPSLGVFQK